MDDESEIIELYKSGLTMQQVVTATKVSMGKVHRILSENGINKSVRSVISDARNKKYPLLERVITLYRQENSITDIGKITKIPLSVIRGHLKRSGVIKSREEAIKIASSKGKMKGRRKGSPTSDEAKKRISEGRLKWSENNAKHKRINPRGYIEFTTGENVGRMEHVIIMEQKIGRRLKKDECVHHIDEDKLNNDINNLALMTRSGHSRHHRIQDIIKNKTTKRSKSGAYCE